MEESKRLEQLYQLSVALGTTLDLAHEAAAFMAWLREVVEPGLAALFITDEAKQELRLMGAHGFELPAEPRLPMGLDLWRWLAERGVSMPEEGDPRRYAVPIPIEQQLFGTLCLVSSRLADQLAEEQRLVQTAAGYLAPVLRNIHRYQTLEQRVAERTAALTALNAMAAAVSQSLDLRETLVRALDATLEATGFEVGGIALWDEEKQRLQPMATRGVEPQLLDAFLGPLRPGGHREQLLRTGQPVFHDDTAHDPTVNPEIARLGFTISGMVPLLHKGKVLGILAVATRAPRQWTEEDKTLLTAVGQQVGVAAANAQLYEEMQRSEEKYRGLVDATTDVIFTIDLEGNILFANPAAKAFTGYEPEETIGHNIAEYVHPDDMPYLLANMQQALRREPLESIGRIGREAEYRLVRRDGRIIWISVRAWPVRDAEGRIVGFSGIARDITERKHAEEALRRASKKWENIFQAIGHPTLILDSQHNVIAANRAVAEVTGRAEEDLRGRKCYEVFHGTDRPPEGCPLERMLTSRRMEMSEAEMNALGGVFLVSCTPVLDESGRLERVIHIATDITERKRTEEALRDAEARYRALVEQLPAIIYIVEFGKVNRTTYISPQVESLLGFSQAEWLADPDLWIKQLHPDDRERVVDEVKRKDAKGEPLDLEYRVLTRDGRVLWFRNQTTLVRDETGRIRYSQGIMLDITERKRAEEALRRRLDELTVLQAIATVGTEASSEDELIERASQIIGETMHLDNFGIILLDEASGLLHPHPSHRLRAGGEALTLRLGEGIVGQVALTGQPRRVPDVRLDPDYVEGDPQTRSELCVPLKVGERVLGVINTESTELDAYSEDDERLLTTVAGQLATAIEKMRLFERMQQRAMEMTSLYTISLRLATAGELDELLQTVVEQVVNLLQARGGGLYLYDQAADELELAVVHGIVLEEDIGTRLKPGEGLSGKVMQERQPMVVDDYRTWEGRSPKYKGRPYTAVIAVPLLWHDQLIGVLDVADDKERRTFDQNDVRLLTLVAQQAAAAIANARSLEAAQRRAEQLAVVNELGRSLAATLDLPTICRTAYEHVQRLVDCPYFGISLFDPERQIITAASMLEEGKELDLAQFPPLRHDPQARTGRSKAIATGRPELVPDLLRAVRESAHEVYRFGEGPDTASALYVPMIVEGQVIGLLEVQSHRPQAYSEEDIKVLTTAANQIGLAIQNARLFEETRRLQEFNQSIVQSMAEGIFMEDTDGVCTFVNPAAAEMLGYAPEELVGQHWTIIVPPDQQPIVQAADERRRRGEADRYEVELVRKDGGRLSVLVSGSSRFEDGRFAGTLAVFTDITERKRAEEELRQSHAQLQKTLEGTVNVLVSAIEMRDPYTAGHQRRVTRLACAIANEMGLPEEQIQGLRMAGLIHDLGKITVPAEVLSKPGTLSVLEYGLIKNHSQIGHDVLKAVEFPWPVAEMVLQHHERMDGSGYPQGLSGEEIMLEARILAVADVVEAMASHRPYRPPRGLDKALEEISQNMGVLYDPEVADACLRLFTEKGFKFE